MGIKSREIYEAPAAVVLLAAHQALETLTLAKRPGCASRRRWPSEYADLVYNGLWFPALRQDLAAYIDEHAALRDRHGAAQALQGRLRVVGRSVALLPLQPRPGHLREGRPVRPERRLGFIQLGGCRPYRSQAQNALAPENPAGGEVERMRRPVSKPADRAAWALHLSLPFDWRLYREDIAGSIAHARMLRASRA